jgi:nucleoside-diphosphate-sugar epimerase
MRVFISSATGVLGRRVVAGLIGSGIEAVALSRSDEKNRCLSSSGALAQRGNLLDFDSLRSISHDCQVFSHLTNELSAPPPQSIPTLDGREMLGGNMVDYLLSCVRCRNTAAKEALSRQPTHPS